MNSYSIQATSTAANVEIVPTNQKRKLAGAWSFMSPPTKLDVKGGRRAPKAFESSKKAFDYLIVLDFEWTCDDKKFGPAESIEFPSVLLSGDEIQISCAPRSVLHI